MAGLNQEDFAVKDKEIDDLTDDFKRKLDEFASDVKTRMRATSPADAINVFNMTLTFLTTICFPDFSKLGAVTHAEEDEIARLKKENKKLKESLAKLEIRAPQTNAAATPTSGMNFTSAAAPPRGPPKSLRQRTSFSATLSSDGRDSWIVDLKLLPGGLVLLADLGNDCVRLFNTQGQHVQSLGLASTPLRLAVMDSTSSCGGDVAVTLPGTAQIAMLRVTQNGLSLNRSIATSEEYKAIAAVDAKTLAVGYWSLGIDLIDLSGNILYQLSSALRPHSMVTTPDNCLAMSTWDNTIAKLSLADRDVLYDRRVGQVSDPRGIACHQDGSCLIVDPCTRTLHLVSPDGVYLRQLLSLPGGRDIENPLWCVSVLGEECVCSTEGEKVFVTDVLY